MVLNGYEYCLQKPYAMAASNDLRYDYFNYKRLYLKRLFGRGYL